MNPVKIGVAGVGSMGFNHCKILQMLKNVEFKGVYDIDLKRSENVAKTFAVQAFSSYNELLNAVDAVIIAVKTSHHFSLTLQAIQRGKHVLVEKPFVSSLKEAEQIIRSVDNGSVVVQVGHVERFNPALIQLTKVINPDKLISCEARRFGVPNRNIDTDVILDLMIHDIDIILALVNSPLSTVSGVGHYNEDGKQIEAASALLSFQNGCFASLISSRFSLEKTRSLYVTEKSRFLKTNLLTKELYIYHKSNISPFDNHSCYLENIVEKVMIPYGEALSLELQHFLMAIESQQPPTVGVHEAFKVLEVALNIKDQIEKNRNRK
ncbi:Gfo/Idh/MocA family oxidoreductase [Peribacillus simplex]|uniref:Gfo/Idh/MocA family oxidoreductase n=1 Tax=Peribacillus simplex TaxID=1478 RepID=UPI003D2909BE